MLFVVLLVGYALCFIGVVEKLCKYTHILCCGCYAVVVTVVVACICTHTLGPTQSADYKFTKTCTLALDCGWLGMGVVELV